MVRHILMSWTPVGHLLQPQVFQFHMSGLPKASSRRNRHGCVGVRPNTNLCTQSQVRHHRLHSESLRCACANCVTFSFRRVQRTRRLCSRPVFDHCAVHYHRASTRRLPLVPIRPIRIDAHVNLHLVVCLCPHGPRHSSHSLQKSFCFLDDEGDEAPL